MLLILTFQDKHEQESLENIHQRYHILKKNSLLEQLLTNKSLECDSSKNTTFQPKKELCLFSVKKKSCFDKNKAASKSLENAIGMGASTKRLLFFFAMLTGGTLWHLQKFLQHIIYEFIPLSFSFYPLPHS
jgi:hypothetical protein